MTFGLRYEEELCQTLRGWGYAVSTEEVWDRQKSIDFIVTAHQGRYLRLPHIFQVTMHWDLYEKMKRFNQARAATPRAVNCYLEYSDRLSVAKTARMIRTLMDSTERRRIKEGGYALRVRKDMSWRFQPLEARLDEMAELHDMGRNHVYRVDGRILGSDGQIFWIIREDGRAYAAHIRSTQDDSIRHALRHDPKALEAMEVTFVPMSGRRNIREAISVCRHHPQLDTSCAP